MLIVTVLLLLGVAMSTAACGVTVRGMIWMLIISRGIVGVGAGGEYPGENVSALQACALLSTRMAPCSLQCVLQGPPKPPMRQRVHANGEASWWHW